MPVAVITGASRGLGLCLARALNEAGWSLILTGRDSVALDAAVSSLSRSPSAAAVPGDVASNQHRQAVAGAAAKYGTVDLVVNNASILGPTPLPRLLDYDVDALESVYRVNTFAPLALIQALRPTLAPKARIINVTSDAGVEAYEEWGGYGSSKAALEHISAVLAAENPAWKVYWVDPGDMRTQMQQDAFPGEDTGDRPPPEESVPGLMRLITEDLASGRYQARSLP